VKMKLEEITKLPLYVVYNELNIALQKCIMSIKLQEEA
jgi:hypothetical protein